LWSGERELGKSNATCAMKLSICIVHYRQEKELGKFLESIFRFAPRCEFEVIVVDNSVRGELESGSVDFETVKMRFHDKKNVQFIVSDRNLGYGRGHEVAVRESRGEYIALCNSDLEACEGSFDCLVEYLREHEEVGLVGPRLMHDNGSTQDSYRRFPCFLDHVVKKAGLAAVFNKRMGRYLMWDKDPGVIEKVDWVVGAVMVMRRSVYKRVGGFDKRFFLFLEDTDLCREVGGLGLEVVYVAESIFFHHYRRLSERSSSFLRNLLHRTFWNHVASSLKYFWKWGSLSRKRIAKAQKDRENAKGSQKRKSLASIFGSQESGHRSLGSKSVGSLNHKEKESVEIT
jgi:GT2 family glycosyltransferase